MPVLLASITNSIKFAASLEMTLVYIEMRALRLICKT
jgi:hypothetical protein